ncbi:hypothetical protein CHX26_04940 [Porphyrobacter sp. HT-58-2]|uniref:hypothetical protein n=1 Tax=Porphyrobacter sp. HT-58-2 TaxID=2023229 RepID=UPI000CDC8D45|nr:hypothetical protein [Porphyrobacter sp. HT-58-2]AUX68941.1 hypothetical protein CHX26_04940 [Porphyrobacter sp. HT-58-2]
MENRITVDALHLKKLIREAEALSDEAIIAMARLKQAMLVARQNPQIEVYTGQRALVRLTEAESHALAMSSNLLRVHDELSKLARVHAGGDLGEPTVIPKADLAAAPAERERERA